jgi:RND family efflux transporter MFP subunit
MELIQKIKNIPLLVKIIAVVAIISLGYFAFSKIKSTSSKPTYTTETATRGTLIVSLSAAGLVSSANTASVTTQTSGVVTKLYVKNGDVVKSGDPIAEVELDMNGQQRANQAYASYQSAKNSLVSAQTTLYSLHSTLFTEWRTYMDLAENSTYTNSDGSPSTNNRTLAPYISTNDDWLSAEAKYKNQQQVIAQAQTSVSSAWASYQQTSPIMYAPISGIISGLSLQIGSVLTSQTSSTGNSTSQRVANIKTDATPIAVVNLSEIDVTKIQMDNKATVTMDAFPDKTFTGHVISIDTTGSVTSGVTTYPAYIVFDTTNDGIYPNMAVNAKIITQVKDDVILVPSSAITSTNGSSTVRILVQGQLQQQPVEIGGANDTQTEIVSGINEGDTVITSVTTTASSPTTNSTKSVFSSFGSGGGVMRVGGR